MELLNNIWMALSTPNEGLISILSIPLLIFIEIPLFLHIYISAFNLNVDTKQKIIYSILTTCVSLICSYLIPVPFNFIFIFLANFAIVYFLFKQGIIKSILMTALPTVVFTLLQNILLTPYLTLLNISSEIAVSTPMYRIPFAILVYAIVFLIYLLIKHKNFKVTYSEYYDKKNKSIIILNFIFGIFTIAMQSTLTFNYISILPLEFSILNFIALLAYFCISFYSLNKVSKLMITTKKLESAEEYNKTLHILHDNVRGFKHDFDNIVTTIGGYINTNDMEGLKKYYVELEDDCERVNNLYVLNPDVVNNPGIYNLLTSKYHEAEDEGIKVNLSFFLNLNEIHMKIYEFAKILGILLDNAIEASKECKENDKVINITFRKETKRKRNIIIIENTYTNKNVDINNIFNKGISGKENHSGIRIMGSQKNIKKELQFKLVYS